MASFTDAPWFDGGLSKGDVEDKLAGKVGNDAQCMCNHSTGLVKWAHALTIDTFGSLCPMRIHRKLDAS